VCHYVSANVHYDSEGLMVPYCCFRCTERQTRISTDNYVAVAKLAPPDEVSYTQAEDCRVTITANPASGFGVGITINAMHTPVGSSFQVFDGDSILSTFLDSFSDTAEDWPSGTQFVGSTTAGELLAGYKSSGCVSLRAEAF
jgi:hypothetical protein